MRAGNERTGRQNIVVPVMADTEIMEGTMVAINEDGYAIPAAKALNLIAAGVCQEYVINPGESGSEYAKVRRGAFVMNNAGDIKATDILKKAYFKDKTTVTLTNEDTSVAGTILQVDSDGVTIDFM